MTSIEPTCATPETEHSIPVEYKSPHIAAHLLATNDSSTSHPYRSLVLEHQPCTQRDPSPLIMIVQTPMNHARINLQPQNSKSAVSLDHSPNWRGNPCVVGEDVKFVHVDVLGVDTFAFEEGGDAAGKVVFDGVAEVSGGVEVHWATIAEGDSACLYMTE